MVLRAPNKWTRKEEVYVVEVTRNADRLVSVFTEQRGPQPGVNVFRLDERT